jgi:NAD(P)-dependent dehydrogenase (short-subunit alcohol dehydrogenase family)
MTTDGRLAATRPLSATERVAFPGHLGDRASAEHDGRRARILRDMTALDGKVALITGAGSGIGKATSERFASEGARIFAVDRDEAGGRAVAEQVAGAFFAADAGEAADIDAAFGACVAEYGRIDIAFLNAGIAIGHADIDTLPDDLYRVIMRVNVDQIVFGTRAAIRTMEPQGGGAIVATASLAGIVPFPPDPVYDLTKHAIVGFIRSVAPSLVAKGITANTVNPGMTDTNIIGEDAKRSLADVGFPLMPPSQIADAVFQIVTTGRTGECWVCQPGRDAEPYRFHEVPGPRLAGAVGKVPPGVREGRLGDWATGAQKH